jgi:hypothetical protein
MTLVLVILAVWAAASVPVSLLMGAMFGLRPDNDLEYLSAPLERVGRRPVTSE